MKVYSWITFVSGAPGNGGEVRAICAARSMAEVARRAGEKSPRVLLNLRTTNNERAVALASAHPGEVLVRPVTDWDASFRVWSKGARWDEMPEATP